MLSQIVAVVALTAAALPVRAQETVPVTVESFVRAETHMYFTNSMNQGGFGKLHHNRGVLPIDRQTVIRGNRDTLYSTGVFDLDAGPVTIEMPDAGERFMSLQIITEDQYTWTEYGAGSHEIDKEAVGTRYVMAGVRTLIDPSKAGDLEAAHRLQDAIRISQPDAPGKIEFPNWDKGSQKTIRDALIVLAGTISDTLGMFGKKGEVDPIRHLIGAATGWGGNAPKDATYVTVVPTQNDGKVVHRLSVKDVPVEGFWSISVYNAEGYFEKNDFESYSLNNITAEKEADSSVTVQFGGCDGKIANCLPITPGWNYWVRLYRPSAEIILGEWHFPEAVPIDAARTRKQP